jgi:hypothetical protein
MSSTSSTLLTVVRVIRLGIFGLVSFFSILVLGLGAHIVSVFAGAELPIDYAALGIAVSLLTLFSLIPMLVLSFMDKVLWVNMVAVEVGWLGVLWILWIATAALTNNDFIACGFIGLDTPTVISCGEVLAFQALSWLNWVLLFKYTIVLIALTIFQHVRGNRVWTAPVYQVNFFAPPPGAPGVVYEQKPGQYPQQPQQYPPQQPQQYPPQQPQQYPPQQPQQYPPQQPQQPGQVGYPPPAPGANYGTPTYQTPPPANPGYQA